MNPEAVMQAVGSYFGYVAFILFNIIAGVFGWWAIHGMPVYLFILTMITLGVAWLLINFMVIYCWLTGACEGGDI